MKKRILPAVAVLCAAAIVVMAMALTRSGQQGFTPPPFEPEAQSGQPTVPQDVGYGELDARAFRFSAVGELLALDGEVEVWLTNPAENTVWLKVRILDEAGNILGESGLLRPGGICPRGQAGKDPEAADPRITQDHGIRAGDLLQRRLGGIKDDLKGRVKGGSRHETMDRGAGGTADDLLHRMGGGGDRRSGIGRTEH